MLKREIDIVVISDIHLGTYGCHAEEVLRYLKSIKPKTLVLNGDIIDIWSFSKSYFPKSHIQVLRHILKMTENGTKTYYLTGNHDEALRRYSGTSLGNLVLDDKLTLETDGKKVWVFHGDVFDATTRGWAKFLAKLGGIGYDILILLNRLINRGLEVLKMEKVSFSKKVKNSVKKAAKWISNFEDIAASIAIDQHFDVVICGHIHQPQMRIISTEKGSVIYLNSGDWVENCTSLEYTEGKWSIYKFPLMDQKPVHNELEPLDIEAELELNKILTLKSLYENPVFSPGYR